MDETTPLIDSQTNGHLTHHPATEPETEPEPDFHAKGDQDDPQQWKLIYKWGIVSLMAFMSFTVTFNCISLVPVAPNIVADLDGRSGNRSTSYAAVLLVTIWELGEAAGPLLIAPLSEVYGRWPVLNAANALFIASTIIAALSPSTSLLIFARFLTGTAVATNVLNPAVIGDMFPPDQRGTPTGKNSLGFTVIVKEKIGYHELKYCIAKKFEALVVLRNTFAMLIDVSQ